VEDGEGDLLANDDGSEELSGGESMRLVLSLGRTHARSGNASEMEDPAEGQRKKARRLAYVQGDIEKNDEISPFLRDAAFRTRSSLTQDQGVAAQDG
jgi:hypothetical protein